MYRFHAIILNIMKIRDTSTRYTLLTKEYGKITAWEKKKSSHGVDIGDIIEVLIERKWEINTLQKTQLLSCGSKNYKNYDHIILFLKTLKIAHAVSSEWEWSSVFSDISYFIRFCEKNPITESHHILLQMRILKNFWVMNSIGFESDPILRYIYHNICTKPLESILQTQKIQTDHLEHIKKNNLHSLYLLKS